MQALMRMRFGPYTFLQNPAQLQVENRALQQEERLQRPIYGQCTGGSF